MDNYRHIYRKKNVQELQRARIIARTLGLRIAARYMQKRGWSFEAAHYNLLGYAPRELASRLKRSG